MLFVKFIVLLLLCFVIISLFSGLYFLVKDKGQSNRTVNALTLRIGLSVLAIVVVLIAGLTGVLKLNPDPLTAPGARETEPSASQPASSQSGGNTGGRTRIEN